MGGIWMKEIRTTPKPLEAMFLSFQIFMNDKIQYTFQLSQVKSIIPSCISISNFYPPPIKTCMDEISISYSLMYMVSLSSVPST